MAFSQTSNTSLSTSEKPIVGDHIAVLGNSPDNCSAQFGLPPSSENISVGSAPTVASKAIALSMVVLAIGPLTVNKPEPGGVVPPMGILP